MFSIVLTPTFSEEQKQEIEENMVSRTESTDTWDNKDGTKNTVLYSAQMNKLWKNEIIPVEDYLNPIVDGDTLIINDPDGNKIISFEMNYEKSNFLSIASTQINLTKIRGGWIFETEVGTDVDSMEYILSSDYEFEFVDDKLIIDNEFNVTIDFSIAKDKQNISTSYDSKDKKLVFNLIGDNNIGNLRMIDPVIKLQDGSNDNMADITLYDLTSYYIAPQLKWNISSIPEGTITSAILCLYVDDMYSSLDTDVRYWRVNDQTWTESSNAATIDGQSLTNQTDDNFDTSPAIDEWMCVDVTNVIETDYELSNTYSSIRLMDIDYIVDNIEFLTTSTDYLSLGGDEFCSIMARSHATTATRPYLNITYEVASSDTCSYTSGNWEIDACDFCNISTDIVVDDASHFNLSDISGCNNGYLNITTGSINSTKFIKGTDCKLIVSTPNGGKFIKR